MSLGLIADGGEGLSDVGSAVAELLRPDPWRAFEHFGTSWAVQGECSGEIVCQRESDARLIERVLTEHTEREAKQYRTEAS
jgi:hypothetical protein